MFPLGLGFPELLVILAICVLVFGAKRLPEIGSGLAKGIRSFKKGLGDEGESPENEKKKEEEGAAASIPGKADGDDKG